MNKLFTLTIAAAAMSCSAFAGTVTYSANYGPTTTNFTTATPFSQFDPSLGTLTSIVFSITGQSSGSVTVTNQSGDDATYNVNIATTVSLRTPANVVLTQVVPLFNDPSFFVADGATATDSGTSAILSNSSTIFSGFAPYTGVGVVNFNVRGTGASSAAGPTPSVVTATTSAAGTASITYNYIDAPPPVTTGIPEPATMMLLGSALLGLGTWKKFGKKSEK